MKKAFLIIILIFIGINYTYSNKAIDSLNQLIQNTLEDKRPQYLNELASKYWFSDPPHSFKLSWEALKIAKKYNNIKSIGSSNYNLGISHLVTSNSDSALYYLNLSLNFFKEIKDTGLVANNYRAIADVYSDISEAEKAQELYILSYNMFDKLIKNPNVDRKFIKHFAILLNNLGDFYLTKNQIDRALDLFNQSILINKRLNDFQGECIATFNLGLCYDKKNDSEKAVESYKKANTIAIETNNLTIQIAVMNALAELYLKVNNLKKAEEYANQALPISIKNDDKSNLVSIYHIKSQIDLRSGNLKRSLQNINIALSYAQKINNQEKIAETYKLIAKIYEKMKNFEKSTEFLNKYITLNDSIFTIQRDNNIRIMDKKFNITKKEKENEELRHINEEAKFNNYKLYIAIIFLVIVLILILAILIILRNRNITRERLNNLLHDKNEQIKKKNKDLKLANSTKDMFFSIIAHDLKNPLGNFKQVTELLADKNSVMNEEEKSEFLVLIKESANHIYALLENLLQWSSSQRNKLKFEESQINLNNLVNDNINFLNLAANNKNIKIYNETNTDYILRGDYHLLNTIIRNLISNAIKFTPEFGEIHIKSIINNSNYEISIVDSGIGMDVKTLDKLFKIEEKITTLGTNQETGTGLGLILCKEFVDKHNGKIWAESEVGKGSKFTISLPI